MRNLVARFRLPNTSGTSNSENQRLMDTQSPLKFPCPQGVYDHVTTFILSFDDFVESQFHSFSDVWPEITLWPNHTTNKVCDSVTCITQTFNPLSVKIGK